VENAQTSTQNIALCATAAEFLTDSATGKLTAIVHRSGRKPKAVAKRFHSVLKQQQKFAESESRGEVQTLVAKGEGWWHLAERFYGDGRYFMSLVAANPQIPGRSLFPGDSITVPTMRSLISDPRTVRAGDSLWTIAERVFGDGARWRDLFDERFTSNPDLIFPASPTKKSQQR
jgi:nucleoid-associated protein YgaU